MWLARHRGAGGVEKRVVVKRILRERIRDPRFLDLFVSEAQISMALAHKNIVPTFDFGRVGDELFLVMEYVEGTNLAMAMREAKRKNLPPSAPLVCHIAFEACQALEYAHGYKDDDGIARRIAHRDVTPANLLLSTAGEVKLSDFGLASATDEHTEAEGHTRGTPRYMAPEQASGGVVGPAADIFALGLILRDCLLFDVLRKGSQEEQLIAAKAPVPTTPEMLSDDMRAICERATQFDPLDRYQTARAMSEDLDRALLNARMAETDDRRPMPERLAAWVDSVKNEETPSATGKGSAPKGHTVTYLDNGAEEVLAALGDATMRSMAATGIEPQNGDASPSESEEPSTKELAPAQDSPTRRGAWVAGAAFAVIALGALAFVVVGSENPQVRRVDASAQPTIDASVADARNLIRWDAAPRRPAPRRPAPDAQAPRLDAHAQSPTKPRLPVDMPSNALGTLRVSTAPWATVVVVGNSKSCDETPCELRLPAGTHTLELRNPVAGLKKVVRVTVKADSVVKIHEILEAPQR